MNSTYATHALYAQQVLAASIMACLTPEGALFLSNGLVVVAQYDDRQGHHTQSLPHFRYGSRERNDFLSPMSQSTRGLKFRITRAIQQVDAKSAGFEQNWIALGHTSIKTD